MRALACNRYNFDCRGGLSYASRSPILGAGRGIYRSIPSLGISPRIRSALVHLVGWHSLLCLACTRRKVYLSARKYVQEL